MSTTGVPPIDCLDRPNSITIADDLPHRHAMQSDGSIRRARCKNTSERRALIPTNESDWFQPIGTFFDTASVSFADLITITTMANGGMAFLRRCLTVLFRRKTW